MGIRRAAQRRQRQYVRGHYRTSKNGNTYWVDGHMRNDSPYDASCLSVILIFIWTFFGWLPALAFSGGNPFGFWFLYLLPFGIWIASQLHKQPQELASLPLREESSVNFPVGLRRRAIYPADMDQQKAWKVLIWGSPFAGGDWLGKFGPNSWGDGNDVENDDLRYLFTTKKAAEKCAAEQIASGWAEKAIAIIEIVTPQQSIRRVCTDDRGGRYIEEQTKDGRPYRRYL